MKLKPLFDIGTCEIHIVHNFFLKGCDVLNLDISDCIVKVFYYFHHRDVRVETFEKIQGDLNLPKHVFIKHVSTRWLTLGPAAERMDEQLIAVDHYFLRYIPKNEKATQEKRKYIDIKKCLEDAHLKVSLQF